jgi:hypothetical protein
LKKGRVIEIKNIKAVPNLASTEAGENWIMARRLLKADNEV